MRPFRDTRPLPQVLRRLERCERPCGSGLVSRKGRKAPPAIPQLYKVVTTTSDLTLTSSKKSLLKQ
ncbi:hypothetical protein C1X72_21525 [Pseudomonas sp. FW306-2-2C-D06B]|nr:hypothetical protein C1X72_21525 [Pseudomonas sp. FW306-2-2C-D06B]